MHTNVDHARLAMATEKFAPVAKLLERVAEEMADSSTVLAKSAMQPIAQNAYAVRYSLRQAERVPLSITFIVAGDNSDLLLLEACERYHNRGGAHPGQVQQQVYRLTNVGELKMAVREKIRANLSNREPRGDAA